MAFTLRFISFAALALTTLGLSSYWQYSAHAAHLVATLSGWLAGVPDAVHGTRLQATPDGFYVDVEMGCLGTESLLTYCAAVLATCAPARQRARGLLLGLVMIALVNPLRIAILYHLYQWTPEMAKWVHHWLFDIVFIVGYVGLFLLWARQAKALPRNLIRADWKFWGAALAVHAIGYGAWFEVGPAIVAALSPGPSHLLLSVLSLNTISDVSIAPSGGWQFMLPAFSRGVYGDTYQPVIFFRYIAYLMFPLLSFALFQSLLGGRRRWQGQAWLVGLGVGVLWYGVGLAVTATAMDSMIAMHAPSPFPPYKEPAAFTVYTPPALPLLYYLSCWLYKVVSVLSGVAGFVLWASLAARERYAVIR